VRIGARKGVFFYFYSLFDDFYFFYCVAIIHGIYYF
jgi:hypothetical protein